MQSSWRKSISVFCNSWFAIVQADWQIFIYIQFSWSLYINNIYGKLQTFKCEIVLFTCASIRCIFLDIVHDCSSSTCASVLKRFFAARGVPTLSISDKDSQFIYNETHSFVNSRGTKWQFNLPSVPWWVTCLNGWYDAWKGVWKSYYDGLEYIMNNYTGC